MRKLIKHLTIGFTTIVGMYFLATVGVILYDAISLNGIKAIVAYQCGGAFFVWLVMGWISRKIGIVNHKNKLELINKE